MLVSEFMEFLPKNPVFDEVLYSEQMALVLSEEARSTRAMVAPPKKKFDRERFMCAMQETFEQIGGVSRLTLWADRNLTEYYKLYAKTIPQANLLDVMGTVTHRIVPALPPSPLAGNMEDVLDVARTTALPAPPKAANG